MRLGGDEIKMIKKVWTKRKKGIVIVGVILAVCLLIVLAIAVFTELQQRKMQETGKDMKNPPEMALSDAVMGSGTTMVGMIEDKYDIDYLDDDLYIEEVYVSSGDEIEAGDKILKFSEDTVTAAREQLEKIVTTAALDFRKGVIANKQSKLDEKKTYDLSIKNGELAQGVYDDAIAALDAEIADLQTQIAKAQEDLTEYSEAIANDAYYIKYEIAEKENTFKTNYAVFYQKVNEWNMAQYLITDTVDDSRMQFVENVKLTNEEKEFMSSLKSLLNMVYNYQEDYESAKEEYEKAKTAAVTEEQQTQVTVEALQLELQEAQLHYEEETVAAKAAYETAVAKSSAAQTTYNTAIKKLEEALETVKVEKEDAEVNLSHFEELVGGGYFCASSKGTVLLVTSTKNTELTKDTMVLAYSNPDTVSVTVSVQQANIAALTIGDTVSVMVTDYGEYEGIITEIEPSSSGSKSNVTYQVSVTLSGDVSKLEVNLAAQVTFGDKTATETETTEKEPVESAPVEKETGGTRNETSHKE